MDQTVTVSSRAARRIAEILKAEPQVSMLRVAVTGGGCSGFQYNFALDEMKADDDLVIERDGAVVLIDSTSLDFLHGAEIDYVDDLIGASFRINNPNAQSSCGCGTSFSV
jgi:iron-sulfur cluster assembly accessory protein